MVDLRGGQVVLKQCHYLNAPANPHITAKFEVWTDGSAVWKAAKFSGQAVKGSGGRLGVTHTHTHTTHTTHNTTTHHTPNTHTTPHSPGAEASPLA